MIDRRDFLAATIGFFGCSLLKLEATEKTPLILPPRLGVRQKTVVTNHMAEEFAKIPAGHLYLVQWETGKIIDMGEKIELEILQYRERVGIYANEGEPNQIHKFVCYDVADPEFIRIKEGSRCKGVHAHTFTDDKGDTCFWEVESSFRIGDREGCMGHRGQIGTGFVISVPTKSKVSIGVVKVGSGDNPIYARRTLAVNGQPVRTDPWCGLTYYPR